MQEHHPIRKILRLYKRRHWKYEQGKREMETAVHEVPPKNEARAKKKWRDPHPTPRPAGGIRREDRWPKSQNPECQSLNH